MNVALITITREKINLNIYDENLHSLDEQYFDDIETLNFFLQTIPRKFTDSKTLLIVNNLENINIPLENSSKSIPFEINQKNIKLVIAKDENSYFIQ